MSDTSQSLSHSRWHGKYHGVFGPKRRRQVLLGPMRKALGPSLPAVARQTACRILAGHARPEHGHLGIEMPPKSAVASVSGFLQGQRALTSARQFSGRERPFSGEPFGARGSAVSTVGFEREPVRASMREPEQADDAGRFERCL